MLDSHRRSKSQLRKQVSGSASRPPAEIWGRLSPTSLEERELPPGSFAAFNRDDIAAFFVGQTVQRQAVRGALHGAGSTDSADRS